MVSTLLIGLDGATFTVLDALTSDRAGDGVVMPFLARILEGGHRATLRSTAHPLTPPAWMSLMTGRTPGNHGIFDFVRFEDLGHDVYFTLNDFRDVASETIWEIASREDRSIVALNFPMTGPAPKVNGSLVPGFVSWKHLRRNMWPQTLYDRIGALEGFSGKELSWDFQRESQIGHAMPDEELYAWVEDHLPRERQWANIACHLLEEDQPDLLAVMFDGVDKIQHQAWHVLDPALWSEDAAEPAHRVRRVVLQYFRELDEHIARLVAIAGPEARVFIASDHGFTGSHQIVRINRYLAELGHLKWRQSDGSKASERRAQSDFANLDWSETLAFCPTPSSNAIFIRKADGAGRPGVPESEYAAFRARLVEDLKKLRHPETGAPVIKNILLREDSFQGSQMHLAPDLTLELSDNGFVSVRDVAPTVAERDIVTGTHHPDGIFLASGPGIARATGARMAITDIASIVMHSVGLPVPSDFEGRVPEGLFTADYSAARPLRSAAATTPGRRNRARADAGTTQGPSEDERNAILEQLKTLGYLDA